MVNRAAWRQRTAGLCLCTARTGKVSAKRALTTTVPARHCKLVLPVRKEIVLLVRGQKILNSLLSRHYKFRNVLSQIKVSKVPETRWYLLLEQGKVH